MARTLRRKSVSTSLRHPSSSTLLRHPRPGNKWQGFPARPPPHSPFPREKARSSVAVFGDEVADDRAFSRGKGEWGGGRAGKPCHLLPGRGWRRRVEDDGWRRDRKSVG